MAISSIPTLYGFRRCPYVIRTKVTLAYSGISYRLREIKLSNKPQAMLDISSKGAVPVMQLAGGQVIDESMDIIYYALGTNDPDGWNDLSSVEQERAQQLIIRNDTEFVPLLNKYKYFEQHPEQKQEFYREQIEAQFFADMDALLGTQGYLVSDKISIADVAIFPLVRQFAYADKDWFFTSQYTHIIRWLESFLESPIFKRVMEKHPVWQEGEEGILIDNRTAMADNNT